MAEGDTILRTARRIEGALAGEKLSVTAPSPRGRAARVEQLDGRLLETVEARGKHLLLHFAGPPPKSSASPEGKPPAGSDPAGSLVLHSHLGMSGSWHLYEHGASWRKPVRSAWVVLRGERWEAVQFGGPTLRVLKASAARRDPQLARLGPDILAAGLDLDTAVRSLRTRPDLNLGEALLDQGLVAGIGNIFKSEACFAARIDPWRQVKDLSDEDLERALACARAQMQQAVTEGRHRFAVYHRARQPCQACGTSIALRGQGDANRTTYWCPNCQASPTA